MARPKISEVERQRRRALLIARTDYVLLEIGSVVDEIMLAGRPWSVYRREARRQYYRDKAELQRIIWRLGRQGLVTRSGRGETAEVEVTEAGQRRIKRILADRAQAPRQVSWDGKWHVVSFDVAETHRVGRNLLRRRLQHLGCIQLQRSVFVYPYDIHDLVEEIRDAYDLRTDLAYMVVERLDTSARLTEKFRARGVLPE